MDNENNNIYYKYEKNDYIAPENSDSIIADKNKNEVNISKLSYGYIKQPKSNEFIIKCKNSILSGLGFCAISIFFAGVTTYAAIYGKRDENQSEFGVITGTIIWDILMLILNIFGISLILKSKLKKKFILTEDYIQIKTFYLLCCRNNSEIYQYINIKSFQVEVEKKDDGDGGEITYTNIVCLDNFNKKNYLIYFNFYLEEATYFVNVVNDFISKKKDMIAIS